MAATTAWTLNFEGYLKKEKRKKCKTAKGQPPLASQQHASGTDAALEEIDRVISEDNYDPTPKNRNTSNPLAGLPKILKWKEKGCTGRRCVRCLQGDQDIVHEILHEVQRNGEGKHHIK